MVWVFVVEKVMGLTLFEQLYMPSVIELVYFVGALQLFTYASLVPVANGESTGFPELRSLHGAVGEVEWMFSHDRLLLSRCCVIVPPCSSLPLSDHSKSWQSYFSQTCTFFT
jgi:hypothetical protein